MAANPYRSIHSLDGVRAFQRLSLRLRRRAVLSRSRISFNVMHLFRFGAAGSQEKAEICAGRDIARADAHEVGGELRPRRKPADADMLTMFAASGDGLGIGVA